VVSLIKESFTVCGVGERLLKSLGGSGDETIPMRWASGLMGAFRDGA
jgi:hypothetical protein